MRKLFCCLLTILILGCTTCVSAQKAYDIILYKAIVNGADIKLELADGYLLASKITINSRHGDKIFAPQVSEPDAKGEFRFEPVRKTGKYKRNKGLWLILKGLTTTEYPDKINATFGDNKTLKKVIFQRSK